MGRYTFNFNHNSGNPNEQPHWEPKKGTEEEKPKKKKKEVYPNFMVRKTQLNNGQEFYR